MDEDWAPPRYYKTIKYGRKYAIQKADGTLRCIVPTKALADLAAKDMNREYRRGCVVVCVETGKEYATTDEAARDAGVVRGTTISKAIYQGRKVGDLTFRLKRKDGNGFFND